VSGLVEGLLIISLLYVLLSESGVLFVLLDDEILRLLPVPDVPSFVVTVLRTTCLSPSEPFPRRVKVVLLATAISDLLPKSLLFTGVGVYA